MKKISITNYTSGLILNSFLGSNKKACDDQTAIIHKLYTEKYELRNDYVYLTESELLLIKKRLNEYVTKMESNKILEDCDVVIEEINDVKELIATLFSTIPLKDRFRFLKGEDKYEDDTYELIEDDNIYILFTSCPINKKLGKSSFSVNQWVRTSKYNDYDGYNVFIQGCNSLNDAMQVANGLEKHKFDLKRGK